ncbi:MAG: invasion associated locus B family protein [Hyphomicrobiales bacterium]
MKGLTVRTIIRIVALGVGFFGIASVGHAEAVNKVFDQWRVNCIETKDNGRVCALMAGLVNAKKTIVFRWAISPDKESKTNQITITTLTGVRVSDGISVQFGQSDPVKVPYRLCMPKFCVAEIPFSDAWLKTLKASKGFTVRIMSANGKELKYDLDLNKFSAAYDFYTAEVAKTQ